MECIFAYLLLALYVDLTLELVRMEKDQEKAVWVKRSLWTNTPFDCGTRAISILAPLTRQKASRNCNRFRKPGEGKKPIRVQSWFRTALFPVSVHPLPHAIQPLSGNYVAPMPSPHQ